SRAVQDVLRQRPGDLRHPTGPVVRRLRRGGRVRHPAARGQRVLAPGGPDPVPDLLARGDWPEPPDGVRRAALARHRRIHGGGGLFGVQAHDGPPPAEHCRRLPALGAHRGGRRPRIRHPEPPDQGLLPGRRDPRGPVLPALALQQGAVVRELRLVRHDHGAQSERARGDRHRRERHGGRAIRHGPGARRPAEAVRADGVRRSHHLLSDRRAARTGAALADNQREAAALAVSPLTRRRTRMDRRLLSVLLAVAVMVAPVAPALAAGEDFIPLLVYRTGPYAPSGIPIANGFIDYFALLNERDGGINGVKVAWEECETQY